MSKNKVNAVSTDTEHLNDNSSIVTDVSVSISCRNDDQSIKNPFMSKVKITDIPLNIVIDNVTYTVTDDIKSFDDVSKILKINKLITYINLAKVNVDVCYYIKEHDLMSVLRKV